MISQAAQQFLKRRTTTSMLVGARRLYSTAQYESFDDNIFYTPVRPVNFSNGRTTVFHQPTSPTEARYVPYEIKETTIKNFLGVFGFVIVDYLFMPGSSLYTYGAITMGLNWLYQVYGYMGNAITRIDLHEDGKTVTVGFKTGGTTTLKVKDIIKKKHEKELVQTFEEGFLFPIEVGSKQYYVYGTGQDAIKNGELFRAIINGQAIKLWTINERIASIYLLYLKLTSLSSVR